jgi:hypothetical protein
VLTKGRFDFVKGQLKILIRNPKVTLFDAQVCETHLSVHGLIAAAVAKNVTIYGIFGSM